MRDTEGCPDCHGTGVVYRLQSYPWGGADWLPDFCHCPLGKETEAEQYAAMCVCENTQGVTHDRRRESDGSRPSAQADEGGTGGKVPVPA